MSSLENINGCLTVTYLHCNYCNWQRGDVIATVPPVIVTGGFTKVEWGGMSGPYPKNSAQSGTFFLMAHIFRFCSVMEVKAADS